MKLHPFGTSVDRSKAHVPKVCNLIAPEALIQQLYHLLVCTYFIPDAIAMMTSRPEACEEEELRLVFKISISLLARLEISK